MALEDVYQRNLHHRTHRAGWLRAAVLGANGCERILEVTLNDEEQAAFDHSVKAVTSLISDMEGLGF